ncbi:MULTISPECIES: NAD(P)H-dependent glycerol-3-phosphate dehydrogenase [unclassified Janthinobacterium]|uniref:NAD(P)H-dependent glycerol-3-phosphate dehydrogenase n=1 Tax=unclassified Janthinobacterium TaxID=2610881 RepID=UPI0025AFABF1|nr:MULTISPECIES: NAD(P)H-dependent glycerol-3-phosphate dehydrogenase [unclassified Janthinobacterium]MDN2717373.1 NAD(P)-dependent glycerol-3-phosphate dehydrogenase [Janthinobacterium sp. SUN120]MDO8067996.1 NAD(P)-dependent glycerol-3-phosphate dehydrogenase [Janthinobacterium sp. SUN206]MDO8074022.1 NAD(P)-dependent glycerol-3-phosphate dehydrogenase [Janthinobacterium sp. SUN176]
MQVSPDTSPAATALPRKITILGAGAWGTAVAMALAGRHDVLLWGRNGDAMAAMAASGENSYLPGFPLPPQLRISADFDAAVAHAGGEHGILIAACPVAGLRPMLQQLKDKAIGNLVWLCKGFEGGTGLLPHQIVQEVLGDNIPGGALSGPSFAQEVARGLPCALTIASHSAALRGAVVSALHGGTIRVYASDDLVGVEVGGAVKNVLAIATGVADGLGLGLNARAALITRGLAEITRLGTALGGQTETFMGLTGMGDLILTCTGDLSRNRRVGLGLAQGKALDTIVAELGHVAEGVPCAKAVRELARRMGVEMPITNAVAGVLFDGDLPHVMVQQLLSRDPRAEAA